jgi:hypothetical protein
LSRILAKRNPTILISAHRTQLLATYPNHYVWTASRRGARSLYTATSKGTFPLFSHHMHASRRAIPGFHCFWALTIFPHLIPATTTIYLSSTTPSP